MIHVDRCTLFVAPYTHNVALAVDDGGCAITGKLVDGVEGW